MILLLLLAITLVTWFISNITVVWPLDFIEHWHLSRWFFLTVAAILFSWCFDDKIEKP